MSIVKKCEKFKIELDMFIVDFHELFPDGIENGYRCKDMRYSKKAQILIRRIIVGRIPIFPVFKVVIAK
jgi:hypothetical protein